MHPSLHSQASFLGPNQHRNGGNLTPSSYNPLKRARTPTNADDDAHRAAAARGGGEKEDGPGERRRRTLLTDLYARSERVLAGLFQDRVHGQRPQPTDNGSPSDPSTASNPNALNEKELPKRSTRTLDEDDYGDEDDEEEEDVPQPSPLQGKDVTSLSRATSNLQNLAKPQSSQGRTGDQGLDDQKQNAEDVRKRLEEEKRAEEDAAKESFQNMFYTLENDRDAMLEQQKLDELDREVETDMSEQQKAAQGSSTDGGPRQGTLSSANLGSSSLALKHLIAKVDAKRNLVKASDAQLRVLMSEVRKNRSRWANEEKVGQEELYESAERVLMDLKARTEYSAPFLQKVNKRDAPDYSSIIKNPMDIGTMMKKLKQLQYQSKKQFVDDLELIWSNCLKYNATPNHPLRRKAEHMRELTRNLTRLIPDITIRDRAEVEAEERRLHPDFDDAEESEDEPLMSTRGRKAPAKTSKKGVATTRKAPAGGDDSSSTPVPETKPSVPASGALSALANFKSEQLRSDADSIGDGSQRSFTTPPPGDSTPIGGSAAPPSQADLTEIEGAELVAHGAGPGVADEPEEEDEEYQTWKQVTKKDRARVAAERHRLFVLHRLNLEEPALLRTKAGMRRVLRLQSGKATTETPFGETPEVGSKPTDQAATLAEGMDVDEDCVLPDYYEPMSNIPTIDEKIAWAEDFEGQVIQKEECLRAIPSDLFNPPASSLVSRFSANLRQMQETRKVVAKIGVVKQMQLQAQTYQNQFQKYDPPPIRDAEIETTVVTEDDPAMSPELCRAVLQRSVGKIFYHAGFEDFQPSALEAITDIAGNYFADIVGQLGLYHDTPKVPYQVSSSLRQPHVSKSFSGAVDAEELKPRFTDEEAILHTLQAFSHDIEWIDSYVKEDLDRLTSRLEVHHARTKDYLAELLRPALDPASVGTDGVGAFNDGSEQFVGGDFAEDLDEDFFGFRELGLDREFGLANLSVPLHLLQSRVHNAYQPASANAAVGPGQVMPQPTPYPPITLETLNAQIGLVKDFFAKKLEANDDEPLVEDDDLPAKQRFPKPRLPPTGKISSPRKRPIREQQQMARKKRRQEIEAEKEREREREAEAAGLTIGPKDTSSGANGVATVPAAGQGGSSATADAVGDADGEPELTNGDASHAGANGVQNQAGDDADKPLTPSSIGRVKLDMPQKDTVTGDPEKRKKPAAEGTSQPNGENGEGTPRRDDAGNGNDGDAQGDAEGEEDDGQTGMISPESLPIAAH